MSKTFDVENNCQYVLKSDDETPQGAKMARRMSRLIARRPDIVQEKPHLAKYKDAEANMKQRAQDTKERRREENPGPVHEDLEDEVKSVKLNIGPKEGRVPSYGGHEGRPTGQPAPSLPASTMGKSDFEAAIYNLPIFVAIRELSKGADGHVASVGVTHGSSILMGKRRDSGRWTLPGGHLDAGEKPHAGGIRELEEESGIRADRLHHLDTKRVRTFDGKDKTIHAFKYEVSERPKTTMSNDPDKEVEKWQWVVHKDGRLPDHIKQNLHSPKNVVLECMGLLKGFSQVSTTQNLTIDLMKSRPHKYIRRYKKGGEWVYIYHEGEHHGRRMDDEELSSHRTLAEHGDEHSHGLVNNIEEGDKETIELLRQLAGHGDEKAKKVLKDWKVDEEEPSLGRLEATLERAASIDDAETSPPAGSGNRVMDSILADWQSRTRRNQVEGKVTVTEARVKRLSRLLASGSITRESLQHVIRTVPMTSAGRAKIRALIGG